MRLNTTMPALGRKTRGNSALVGALLGAVFFLSVFGFRVLNPTYVAWQLTGDPGQHYLGWEFFRYENWHWPLGKIVGYGTPDGSSVVYTDSIPIMAILFKSVRWALPKPFQYTGLWMLLCYVLQGLFGWLLSALHTKSAYAKSLMTCFFLLSPAMLDRCCKHHALMAHWLILAAIYLGLQDTVSFKRRHPAWNWNWCWLLVILASSLVHLYICVMVAAIYCFAVLLFISEKRWRGIGAYACLALPLLTMFLALYIEGAFVVGPQGRAANDNHLGSLSMNLLAPFTPGYVGKPEDSAYVSYFVAPHREQSLGYREGFNYLGLGTITLIVLSIIVFVWLIVRCRFGRKAPAYPRDARPRPLYATSVACFCLALLSLSNHIRLGQNAIASYELCHSVQYFTDAFRSSGRFFWPLGYLLLWFGLRTVGMIGQQGAVLAIALLHGAFILQLIDLSQFIRHFASPFQKVVQFQTPFKDAFWSRTIPNYRNLFFYPPGDTTYYVQLGMLAAPNQVGINVAFKARRNPEIDDSSAKQLKHELERAQLRTDAIYIFKSKSLFENLTNKLPRNEYISTIKDDFCVVAKSAH